MYKKSHNRITKKNIDFTSYFSVNIINNIRGKFRLYFARKIFLLLKNLEWWDKSSQYSNLERPTIERIHELEKGIAEDVEARLKSKNTLIIDDEFVLKSNNRWAICIRAIIKLIENDPSIKSLMNIGCYDDSIFAYLSKRYPNLNFISLDFDQSLEKLFIKIFDKGPNWEYISGYPLDQIELRSLNCDVALFAGTIMSFTNSEYRKYLQVLKKNGVKHVISVESWVPYPKDKNVFHLLYPEDINPHQSLNMGKTQVTYLHNYTSILDEEGYNVTESTMLGKKASTAYHLLVRASLK